MNLATNTQSVNDETKRIKIGFVGSFGLLHCLNSKLSLNFKLIFESKGIRTENAAATPNRNDPNSFVTGKIAFTTKLSYLSFAPLLRYQLGNTNIFVEGGPYLGYLLRGTYYEETSFTDPAYNYHTTFNAQNDNTFKELDFGASASLGYKIKINELNNVTIQVMDNIGLVDIINKSGPHNASKNTAISFLIGISLREPLKTLI